MDTEENIMDKRTILKRTVKKFLSCILLRSKKKFVNKIMSLLGRKCLIC